MASDTIAASGLRPLGAGIARAITAGLVVAFLLSCQPRPLLRYPSHFSADWIVCEENKLGLIGTSSRSGFGPHHEERVAGMTIVDGQLVEWGDLGWGWVQSESHAATGEIFILKRSRAGSSGTEDPSIHVADGVGREWRPIENVPPGALGIAMLSGQAGYVWSEDHVYVTADGARTWRRLGTDGVRLRKRGPSTLGADGSLYVVGSSTPQPLRATDVVLRVPPGETGQATIVWRPSPVVESQISEMSTGSRGELLLLVRNPEERSITFEAFDPNSPHVEPRRVSIDGKLPSGMFVTADAIVIGVSIESRFVSRARWFRSLDHGASWQGFCVPDPRIKQLRMTKSGIVWAIGAFGAVYTWKPEQR